MWEYNSIFKKENPYVCVFMLYDPEQGEKGEVGFRERN